MKIYNTIKKFFNIIHFCFNISWKSSKKYFLLRSIIEVIIAIIPFGMIFLGKKLINLLVLAINDEDNKFNNIYNLIALMAILLLLNIFCRILQKIKEYCAGIHKELITKKIETQIANKTISLDLSYFDSTKFYNEMMNAKRDSNALQTLTWFVIDMIRAIIHKLFYTSF